MTSKYKQCSICKEGTHDQKYPMCLDCAKKPFTEDVQDILKENGWALCSGCKSRWHADRWDKCYTCANSEKQNVDNTEDIPF